MSNRRLRPTPSSHISKRLDFSTSEKPLDIIDSLERSFDTSLRLVSTPCESSNLDILSSLGISSLSSISPSSDISFKSRSSSLPSLNDTQASSRDLISIKENITDSNDIYISACEDISSETRMSPFFVKKSDRTHISLRCSKLNNNSLRKQIFNKNSQCSTNDADNLCLDNNNKWAPIKFTTNEDHLVENVRLGMKTRRKLFMKACFEEKRAIRRKIEISKRKASTERLLAEMRFLRV